MLVAPPSIGTACWHGTGTGLVDRLLEGADPVQCRAGLGIKTHLVVYRLGRAAELEKLGGRGSCDARAEFAGLLHERGVGVPCVESRPLGGCGCRVREPSTLVGSQR